MNAFLAWLAARAKEPSSYAGIAAAVAGFTFLPADEVSLAVKAISAAAIAIPAILAVVLPEAKK